MYGYVIVGKFYFTTAAPGQVVVTVSSFELFSQDFRQSNLVHGWSVVDRFNYRRQKTKLNLC